MGYIFWCTNWIATNLVFRLLDHNRNFSIHLVPTSPRGQGSYANPGQTLVSPIQLVPTLPKGRSPTQERQQSVSGHLVPPCTGGPVHQGAERQPGADKGQPQVKWSAAPRVTVSPKTACDQGRSLSDHPSYPRSTRCSRPHLARADPQPGPGPPPRTHRDRFSSKPSSSGIPNDILALPPTMGEESRDQVIWPLLGSWVESKVRFIAQL